MFPLVIDPGGIQELMDGSPQSASYTPEEANASLLEQHVDGHEEESSPHIHLPNPCYWPVVLSAAVAVTIGGLVFVSIFSWISLIAIIFHFKLLCFGIRNHDSIAHAMGCHCSLRS